QGVADTVRAVEVTPDGAVWIASLDGLVRWSGQTARGEQIEHYKLLFGHGIPLGPIALHTDATGTLWVGADDAFGSFVDGRFSQASVPSGFALGRVTAMASDSQGRLWLCHANYVRLSRWFRDQIESFDNVPELSGRSCTSVLVDSRDRVWVGFA